MKILYFVILSLSMIFISHHALASSVPTHVGGMVCKGCHTKEYSQWTGSHHDLAMQKVDKSSILGDFNQSSFSKHNITTRFYKDGERFMVETDGADGKLQNFEISYTFGVYPLQQYMVKFPGGKIQVLDIAWDTRTKEEGGQRWFSLHPDDEIKAGDVLHWTGPNLNWNYMCADCHSTNLKKNYDPEAKTYQTGYSDINVSCEACHGPGSEHVKLYRSAKQAKDLENKGLTIVLSAIKNIWKINQKNRKPELKSSITRDEVGQPDKAHEAFEEALRLQPQYIPAYVNFATYYHQKNNEKAALNILQKGLKNIPDAAALHHALGLWYVRNQDKDKALVSLRQAAKLSQDNARYQYVYAVAMAEKDVQKSIQILEQAQQIHNGNVEILSALSSYNQQLGNDKKAEHYRNIIKQVMTVKTISTKE